MIQLFGSTIKETSKALAGKIHLGGDQVTNEDKTKAIGRIIVTCLMIGLAVYLFAIGKTDIGGTIVGAVTGYWIK